ncbi:RNA polymerase sigma factor [Agrobacterium vitis]|uniref:RNA polymerase sigma factor n=1 Tax=Rhizobium/Agrobacterium group TaxID=227290 RepID=UPI000AA0AABE|nr:RNA polymerase sigma factor [Agrobacterium vitis]
MMVREALRPLDGQIKKNARSVDTDQQLILSIVAGREDALAHLVERHGKSLTAFTRRYLGSYDEDADDIVQGVFWTVWRKAASFDPGKAQVKTWLYRIAANRCIDAARRKAVLRFVGLHAMAGDPALDDPDAETTALGRSQLALARKGILKLPRRQRMALLLRGVGDLDVQAIAKIMDVSTGSVEQLLVRARRGLRDYMEIAERG